MEGSGLTGEPSAAVPRRETWVAYPTAAGVILRRCTLDASENPSVGPAIAVPASQGALPTLTAVAGRLALWLWRDAGRALSLRLIDLTAQQIELGPEEVSGLTSLVPVASAAGAEHGGKHTVWLATLVGPDPKQARIVVHRLTLEPMGKVRLEHSEAVTGTFSPRRPTLLWQPERGLEPHGRLFVFGGGVHGVSNEVGAVRSPMAGPDHFDVGPTPGYWRRLAAPALLWKNDGDFASRSAPGAAGSAMTSPTCHGYTTGTPVETIGCCWATMPVELSRKWVISTMALSSARSGWNTRSPLSLITSELRSVPNA